VDDLDITLTNSGLSTANYDDTLIGWEAQTLQPNVTFDAGLSTYCDAAVQRQNIIDTFTWTINDSGENCPPVEDTSSFIMQVKTDNPGSSADNEFSLRALSVGELTPSYTVDCDNDGIPEFSDQGTSDVTCSYLEPGEYEIALLGTIPHLRFDVGYDPDIPNSGQSLKILDVLQWGDIEWRSMESMFY